MSEVLLTPAEARVIAALVEKSITTPQYYPMTVNAIMLAANQKSCRHPVMNLSEGDVGAALSRLESDGFVARDTLSGRVTKWRHRFQHQLLLKPASMAVLATLILRGPQTVAELRANASTLGGPADAEGVAEAIRDLGDRAQPLVAQLARAAGQKEARYAHRLCGDVAASESLEPEVSTAEAVRAPAPDALAALEERVRALETRLAELERRVPAD
jgi:uncharacterized protein YceH (UPF0502 family)